MNSNDIGEFIISIILAVFMATLFVGLIKLIIWVWTV